MQNSKPIMTRVRAMKVGATIRLDIRHRSSTKPQVYSHGMETGKKFTIKTAQNKCSFTVTRLA